MKAFHISDIHFRGLSRHDEYRKCFTRLFDIARKEKPDVFFVGGDIVHSKTQGITPELIDILTWCFETMAEIAPVHMILGNHDFSSFRAAGCQATSPIITIDRTELYIEEDRIVPEKFNDICSVKFFEYFFSVKNIY
jgi:DNA repair exonuclease SbcCD nuclease subunit